jgi:hypothetical protein
MMSRWWTDAELVMGFIESWLWPLSRLTDLGFFILVKFVNSYCFCVTFFCYGLCKLGGMWYLP